MKSARESSRPMKRKRSILRRVRVVAAIMSVVLITLLFLDFSGTLHPYLGWIAKIQLVPALLALNLGGLLFVVVATLVLGRVYCSVLCPLGIMQDTISRVSAVRKKNRFHWSKPKTILRYVFLGLFVLSLVVGVPAVVAILDPYSVYGRIASNLLSPIVRLGNNLLAFVAEKNDSYAFYTTEVWVMSGVSLGIAAASLVIIGFLAWRGGRTWCNTLCPVGTLFGLLSRFSILKPVIDTDTCNACKLCSKNCKASCIDIENQSIDYSRCVACFDCIERCPKNSMGYKSSIAKSAKKEPRISGSEVAEKNAAGRRSLLYMAAALLLPKALKAANTSTQAPEGGLAEIEEKRAPARGTPITPPGSLSHQNITAKCTGCGLCVSACPSQLLKPSHDVRTLLQPRLSYIDGYCRPECTECASVCPTGAIQRITKAEKAGLQIGFAVWSMHNCVVLRDDVNCDNCKRHCPTGAIQMISSDPKNPKARKIPAIDTERCIGCGACEHLCPARPGSAIYVEGIERHRVI